ncbi:hypothetical protein HZ326_24824 [Fusarium oxysporum f. sp. albedinis]|nr:hypothetical protein HZ326_24824 [Fusarium oxysporum f. sp. albedinis]
MSCCVAIVSVFCRITWSVDTLIPARWTGLILVLVLIGIHLGLIFTTLIFLRITDSVESVDIVLDDEVKKWAKTTGRSTEVYAISNLFDDGKVEARLLKRKEKG